MYGTSRCSLSSSTVLSVATCAVQFLAYLVVTNGGFRLYGTLLAYLAAVCSLYSTMKFTVLSVATCKCAAYLVVQFLACTVRFQPI